MTALSVIIPWCDRPELARTLVHNAPQLSAKGRETIIVNCGGDGASIRPQLTGLGLRSTRWLELAATTFNKRFALNLGVSRARGDTVFLLDADILLHPTTIADATGSLTPGAFVTIERVHESRTPEEIVESALQSVAHTVEFVDDAGRTHRIVTNRLHLRRRTRSGPGLPLVRKADFIAVGGMNSELRGWGWDDLDLVARLQMRLGLVRREAGAVTHLSHGDAVRSASDSSRLATESRNFMHCLAAYCVGDDKGSYDNDVRTAGANAECQPL
jgi:glycosyltransferase involved in cell wall biosynthesis